ncbi:hypothetical protein [Streptomyces soliscabiei]|uniref:hypothetical protein n=1 Tax=Streptomyces soliscabiei TaxID=588897 RepID=UPI0029BA7DD5|nr:hypothetical protein [Streptomyces sp. NY05-11A]MDX2682322.1 hypothetical protein [Streptomyces sp. NY05-11A]
MADLERIATEIMAYYRTLDEGATLRHHFRHADEEDGLWYIEAVPDRGELVVVKQVELTSAGQLGARWQLRGALRQAEATVQAALKQSEAAVAAVAAQARHENSQWRRVHRRDIWLEFVEIVDDFGWKISQCRMAAFHRDDTARRRSL